MQFKASKFALLAAAMMQESNRQEETKISLCEYTNEKGERCQLQLVATSDFENQVPVDPRCTCVEVGGESAAIH
jgi:hypothetical protein